MKLSDFSSNLVQIIFLAKKNRVCSVSMVTDLLKVLFGSFFHTYFLLFSYYFSLYMCLLTIKEI